MNGDKRPDVLTAQRKGAYIFFNNVTGFAGAHDEFAIGRPSNDCQHY